MCKSCRMASRRPPVIEDTFVIEGELCRKIPLTREQYAIVDAAEYDTLMGINWYAWRSKQGASWYAAAGLRGGKVIYMHSFLLPPPEGHQTDHKNGDTLDNRRSNLRPATYSQQHMNMGIPADNTSGCKGVSWSERDQRYVVYINANKRRTILGYFKKDEFSKAVELRRAKEQELFGEFSRSQS